MKHKKSPSPLKQAIGLSVSVHLLAVLASVGWFPNNSIQFDSNKFYEVEFSALTTRMDRAPKPLLEVQVDELEPIVPKEPEAMPQEQETVPVEPPKKEPPKKVEPPRETPPSARESATTPAAHQVTADAGDFHYAYYVRLMQNRVREKWKPPYQSSGQTAGLTAIASFRVRRNGEIIDIRIEKTSGRFLYDQAAQRALYEAGPLPPLPAEYPGEALAVRIEFEVNW